MQRFLIEAITAKIAADLPEFKTVALFNEQLTKQDEGGVDSFQFPALFISFPEGAEYSTEGAGVQKTSELLVRFYIADKLTVSRSSIGKTELEVFDLKQKVYGEFKGFQGDGFGSWSRVGEQTDESRKNQYIFIQDYTTVLLDVSKYIDQGEPHLLTFQLGSEVIINPTTDNGLRTAKDVNDNT
tara:strand:- start:1827 stop:2378 length:552 start_codon:yes stop_codon:yes gene_type:complete